MSNNSNLSRARKVKDDEYYTRYEDVENELKYYWAYLRDKIIYCPCDDDNSNFVKYLKNNQKEIGYKMLVYTSFKDGFDFRLQDNSFADVIITNAPFSLFREFIDWCGNKDFILLGPNTSPTLSNVFSLFKEGFVNFGINVEKHPTFDTPNGPTNKVNISWITTYPIRQNDPLKLEDKDLSTYEKYDDYDAIEVPRVKDIPNYDGLMGVPFTFLEKWNFYQFDVIDLIRPTLNGKKKFPRVVIKKRFL